jgi:hypothetical protein
MDAALVLIVALAGLVVSLCCIADGALLRALDDAVVRLHTTKG